MKIKAVKLHESAKIPQYMTAGAAGFDLHCVETVTIQPNHCVILRTGLALELPPGYEVQVRGRSGLSFQLDVEGVLGTIDSDYRGEIKVKLWNWGKEPVHVSTGDRIAQGVLQKVKQAKFVTVDKLTGTARGTGGFGHTGL